MIEKRPHYSHDIDENSITKWLFIAARHLTADLDQELAKYGINSSQYFYIVKIHDHPGITQDQLIEGKFLNQSNVARAILQLQKVGLVVKERSSSDKRKFVLSLTSRGRQLYPIIVKLLDDEEQRLIALASQKNNGFDASNFVKALHNIVSINEFK